MLQGKEQQMPRERADRGGADRSGAAHRHPPVAPLDPDQVGASLPIDLHAADEEDIAESLGRLGVGDIQDGVVRLEILDLTGGPVVRLVGPGRRTDRHAALDPQPVSDDQIGRVQPLRQVGRRQEQLGMQPEGDHLPVPQLAGHDAGEQLQKIGSLGGRRARARAHDATLRSASRRRGPIDRI